MAHGFRLGEARQANHAFAVETTQTRLGALGLRQVDATMLQIATLEDERFGLFQTAGSGDGVGIAAGGDVFGHAGGTALCVHAHLTALLPGPW